VESECKLRVEGLDLKTDSPLARTEAAGAEQKNISTAHGCMPTSISAASTEASRRGRMKVILVARTKTPQTLQKCAG